MTRLHRASALAALAACGGGTEPVPASELASVYALVSINGSPVPYTYPDLGAGGYRRVLSSSVELEPGAGRAVISSSVEEQIGPNDPITTGTSSVPFAVTVHKTRGVLLTELLFSYAGSDPRASRNPFPVYYTPPGTLRWTQDLTDVTGTEAFRFVLTYRKVSGP